MTVTLDLTKEQEALLQRRARTRGVDTSVVLREIVDTALEADNEIRGKNPDARIFDLHKDNILYISDDFDHELPDTFWFGKV